MLSQHGEFKGLFERLKMAQTNQDQGVLSQQKLHDLVGEVDPKQVLDEDVEEMLMQMADDFIESVVTSSCKLALHRKSNNLETRDLQLHLERSWNIKIPGFGGEEPQTLPKKSTSTEAHKQRVSQVKKARR